MRRRIAGVSGAAGPDVVPGAAAGAAVIVPVTRTPPRTLVVPRNFRRLMPWDPFLLMGRLQGGAKSPRREKREEHHEEGQDVDLVGEPQQPPERDLGVQEVARQ